MLSELNIFYVFFRGQVFKKVSLNISKTSPFCGAWCVVFFTAAGKKGAGAMSGDIALSSHIAVYDVAQHFLLVNKGASQ